MKNETTYIIHFVDGEDRHRVGYALADGSHGTNRHAAGKSIGAACADQLLAMLGCGWCGTIRVKVAGEWDTARIEVS